MNVEPKTERVIKSHNYLWLHKTFKEHKSNKMEDFVKGFDTEAYEAGRAPELLIHGQMNPTIPDFMEPTKVAEFNMRQL